MRTAHLCSNGLALNGEQLNFLCEGRGVAEHSLYRYKGYFVTLIKLRTLPTLLVDNTGLPCPLTTPTNLKEGVKLNSIEEKFTFFFYDIAY